MPKITILGVKFNQITMKQTLAKVGQFVKSSTFHYIVTPNPEFVVLAQKDHQFRDILNDADISIADGAGIIWAAKHLKTPLPERIPGADFVLGLLPLAAKRRYRLYLLGGEGEVAYLTKKVIEAEYPDIVVVGAESGPYLHAEDIFTAHSPEIFHVIERINQSQADILLVAFGAPKQEKFIYRHRHQLKVKVAIGIGGVFNYLSGVTPRAPEWLRKIGLEWLHRFFLQPRRLKRIYRAIIVFPYLVYRYGRKSRK